MSTTCHPPPTRATLVCCLLGGGSAATFVSGVRVRQSCCHSTRSKSCGRLRLMGCKLGGHSIQAIPSVATASTGGIETARISRSLVTDTAAACFIGGAASKVLTGAPRVSVGSAQSSVGSGIALLCAAKVVLSWQSSGGSLGGCEVFQEWIVDSTAVAISCCTGFGRAARRAVPICTNTAICCLSATGSISSPSSTLSAD